MTVLLVTHNPELAERADQRLRLVDGLVQPS
jgi:predicted ABC-type transport system involved in lysophospholipase L1 biosynthesis ATPase subunit